MVKSKIKDTSSYGRRGFLTSPCVQVILDFTIITQVAIVAQTV